MPEAPESAAPVRVGVVGAGYWARDLHVPLHRAGRETSLTGVWTRSPARRAELAARGIPVWDSFDALLEASEAVDLVVPPSVQPDLAVRVARAGRALLLEKPLAVDAEQAHRVADAVREAGVVSALFLTRRYHPAVRSFLRDCAEMGARTEAVRASQVHGGFLPGGFLTEPSPWRDEMGALMDLGPHVLDLAEQVAGPVERVRVRTRGFWTAIDADHAGGAVGQHAVSGGVKTPGRTVIETFGPGGSATLDTLGLDMQVAADRLRAEFARAVRSGDPVTADARRGHELAVLLDACRRSLVDGAAVDVPLLEN